VAASDLDKLEALCALGTKLSAWEQDAFPDILARLKSGHQKTLTSRQREKVDDAYLRYDCDADEPAENLFSSGKVAKTDVVFPYEKLPRPLKPPGKEAPTPPRVDVKP
jgi:hypothetical protein